MFLKVRKILMAAPEWSDGGIAAALCLSLLVDSADCSIANLFAGGP